MRQSTVSILEKVALAGGVGSLVLSSGHLVEGAIISSASTPIRPPTTAGFNSLDIDGDGTIEFALGDYSSGAAFLTSGNGRFVAAASAAKGFQKLSSGFVVGSTMPGSFKFFSSPQPFFPVTAFSAIAATAAAQGWSMGDTGYFGYKFTSGGNTLFGWGEMVIDPAASGTAGYGFTFTKLYYDDTGAPIVVGDTGSAVPEPSTWALAVLAAGGVTAYRARRKVDAV